jgi:hypothetical protein
MSIQAMRSWVMQSSQHRFFTLAIGITSAVAFGWLLGEAFVRLFGNEAALAVIKTVTTAAIVFAVWKIALDHAATIASFVRAGSTANIRRAFVEMVVAMIGLGVAAGTSTDEPTAPPSSLVAMSFVQPASSRPMDMLTDRIVLPVFSNNLDERVPLACNASTRNPALMRLAKVDESAIPVLREIACGLRACSTGPSVRVDVQGFASSQPFDFAESSRCANSKQMNHVLAEMRRHSIIDILEGDVSRVPNCKRGDRPRLLGKLDIERRDDAFRWPSPEEMQAHVGWMDTPEAGGDADRGREVLTRRVDIIIVHKGSCSTSGATALTAANAN